MNNYQRKILLGIIDNFISDDLPEWFNKRITKCNETDLEPLVFTLIEEMEKKGSIFEMYVDWDSLYLTDHIISFYDNAVQRDKLQHFDPIVRLDNVKNQMVGHIEQLRYILETSFNKTGDTCSNSQYVCIEQSIIGLQAVISSLSEEDIKKF